MGFMHFWLAFCYSCCLFCVRYRCIWGRCGRCSLCGVSWHPWIGRALKHCHSRWDHLGIIFCRKVITTSGIGPKSWNFWGKEMSGKVDIHTGKNLTPKIGIDTEIASISVSVAKLLLFPVWGTVSTSGLYLMVFYVVWGCRRKCKGIGRARKLCRSRWDHVEMSSHRLVITTSGLLAAILDFRLPVVSGSISTYLKQTYW